MPLEKRIKSQVWWLTFLMCQNLYELEPARTYLKPNRTNLSTYEKRQKNLQGKAQAHRVQAPPSHLRFNAFRVVGLAVPLLAGLPGILRLSQVHIFLYRHGDDLSGLPSLAGLRPSRSNIQQLGQEHYIHSENPECLCLQGCSSFMLTANLLHEKTRH